MINISYLKHVEDGGGREKKIDFKMEIVRERDEMDGIRHLFD